MKREVVEQVRERSNGACEAGERSVCTYRAAHIHHKKLRSQGGSDDPRNLLFICQPCHLFIHSNVSEAKTRGWLTPSWAPEFYGGEPRE